MTTFSKSLRAVWATTAPLNRQFSIHHRRLYQSYEDPPEPSFSSSEDAILSAALSHVPSAGFTTEALKAGARDAGYLDITTNLFPDGPVALIKYHLVSQRLALSKHFPSPYSPSTPSSSAADSTSETPGPSNAATTTTALSIPSKIRSITLHRLHANAPIIQHWQSALALLSQPKHAPLSVRELALLADEVLFLAGSTTVTSAWYTDRAGLMALYASADMFMTTDTSENFQDTKRFVETRLEEADRLRAGASVLGTWVNGQFGGLIDGLRSKGIWI